MEILKHKREIINKNNLNNYWTWKPYNKNLVNYRSKWPLTITSFSKF